MDHSIKINKDKIIAFRLPIKSEIINEYDEIELFIKDIFEEDRTIEIHVEYNIKQKKHYFKKYYKKETLNPYELLFIGWSYLIVYNKNTFKENEVFKNKAKEFLIQSIKKGIESCLPHYLLADYPLDYIEGINCLENLYFALDVYDDGFQDFYSLVYIQDKNKIRALGLLKKGLVKFPKSFILNYHRSNYLISINNYKEALCLLNNANINEYKDYGIKYLTDYFYSQFICNIKLENFKNAEKIIKNNETFNDYEKSLLNGLLSYYKEDYGIASNYFIDCIQKYSYFSGEFCSYYFLMDCYLKLKKYNLINEVLNNIPEEQIDYIDYHLDIEFLELAENCLTKIIELDIDETIIAKAKGLLASIILYDKLPRFIDEPKRKLTNNETLLLEKSESLIKYTIDFYPYNMFFLAIYSDILYLKEKYDESMIIKLRSFESKIYDKESEVYANISLNLCSEEFTQNYKKELEKLFLRNMQLKEIYFCEQLSSDIEDLYNIKRYDVIVDLYFYFKEDIDLKKSDYLFEIAYSLKENEYIDDSEFIYSKILESEPKNTSVLNNLAIIFEAKGDLGKAVSLIKKAKGLNNEDIIINNNFSRLTGQIKSIKDKGSKTISNNPPWGGQSSTYFSAWVNE